MHKKLMLTAVGILSILQVIFAPLSMAIKVAPGVFTESWTEGEYPVNEMTDFVITRINPSKNAIYAVYANFSGLGEEKLRVINIQQANYDDKRLAALYGSNPFDAVSIYNRPAIAPYAQFYEGDEEEILSDVDLTTLDLSKLVYSVRYSFSSDVWLAGRIDISRCVTALEYRDGMECQAEETDDGFLEYQLYDGGERIEMTWAEEETEEVVEDNKEEIAGGAEEDVTADDESVDNTPKDELTDDTTMESVVVNDGNDTDVSKDKVDERVEVDSSKDMTATDELRDELTENFERLPVVEPTLMVDNEIFEAMPTTGENAVVASAYSGGFYNREATLAAVSDSTSENVDVVNMPELGPVCQREKEWWWIPGFVLLLLSAVSWCASFRYQYKLRKESKKSRLIENE